MTDVDGVVVTQSDRDRAADMMTAWDGSRAKAAEFLRHGGMDDHDFIRAMARHRIEATQAGWQVPPGWKLVPEVPTQAMVDRGLMAFMAAHDPMFSANEPTAPIYKAMLAAAPTPPSENPA